LIEFLAVCKENGRKKKKRPQDPEEFLYLDPKPKGRWFKIEDSSSSSSECHSNSSKEDQSVFTFNFLDSKQPNKSTTPDLSKPSMPQPTVNINIKNYYNNSTQINNFY
jgi:hypothetical protein